MSINGINTQYQNYAASGTAGAKGSSGSNSFDAFQKEVVNWEKRIKDNIDKEKENDSNGSIQMSEKQWRNLIKRVDYAIDALKGNVKEQEQEGKKQVEEKNLTRKDTVAADSKTDNTPIQFLNRELVLR